MSNQADEHLAQGLCMAVAAWFKGSMSLAYEEGLQGRLTQEEVVDAALWGTRKAEALFDAAKGSTSSPGPALAAAGEGIIGDLRRSAYITVSSHLALMPWANEGVVKMWRSNAKAVRKAKVFFKSPGNRNVQ